MQTTASWLASSRVPRPLLSSLVSSSLRDSLSTRAFAASREDSEMMARRTAKAMALRSPVNTQAASGCWSKSQRQEQPGTRDKLSAGSGGFILWPGQPATGESLGMASAVGDCHTLQDQSDSLFRCLSSLFLARSLSLLRFSLWASSDLRRVARQTARIGQRGGKSQ